MRLDCTRIDTTLLNHLKFSTWASWVANGFLTSGSLGCTLLLDRISIWHIHQPQKTQPRLTQYCFIDMNAAGKSGANCNKKVCGIRRKCILYIQFYAAVLYVIHTLRYHACFRYWNYHHVICNSKWDCNCKDSRSTIWQISSSWWCTNCLR